MKKLPLRLLRIFSLADGVSFLILLYFSIYEKRMLGNQDAIRIPGMIHGVIFTVFFVLLIWCWDRYHWTWKRVAQVFLSALVPLAPFFLETQLKKEQSGL
jgi:integral membrane protein